MWRVCIDKSTTAEKNKVFQWEDKMRRIVLQQVRCGEMFLRSRQVGIGNRRVESTQDKAQKVPIKVALLNCCLNLNNFVTDGGLNCKV